MVIHNISDQAFKELEKYLRTLSERRTERARELNAETSKEIKEGHYDSKKLAETMGLLGEAKAYDHAADEIRELVESIEAWEKSKKNEEGS